MVKKELVKWMRDSRHFLFKFPRGKEGKMQRILAGWYVFSFALLVAFLLKLIF